MSTEVMTIQDVQISMKDDNSPTPKWLEYPHLAWHLVALAKQGRIIADDLDVGIRPAKLKEFYEVAKTFVQLYESAKYDEGNGEL